MRGKIPFTFIDLFAGIGGFHNAFSQLGGECIAFSEISKDAIHSYCENYNISSNYNLGDLRKVKELPSHDILFGGVPCQSWSIAGKNLGFEDDRGQLWNDTIYLLNQSKPKAFIFENVKGLFDPRNRNSLNYIMDRIKMAGYHANFFLLNSYDFGVFQNRVRVYIIGFREKKFYDKFKIAHPTPNHRKLYEILNNIDEPKNKTEQFSPKDLFGNFIPLSKTRLQKSNELNHFFIFSDIRNGHTTIHSWDIIDTTDREKYICLLLLKNRRKKLYGSLDGNPLSLQHFKKLDNSIEERELVILVEKGILKEVDYTFQIEKDTISNEELKAVIDLAKNNTLRLDFLKSSHILKLKRINVKKALQALVEQKIIKCIEKRFEFKFTKISSGIFGVNRIYLPTSDIYPTMVASDTNDFIATKCITASSPEEYKKDFLEKIYKTNAYRKITKEEACILQGFPRDFKLPESRARWMKLIGNSVSIPVIKSLGKSIIETGVFDNTSPETYIEELCQMQK